MKTNKKHNVLNPTMRDLATYLAVDSLGGADAYSKKAINDFVKNKYGDLTSNAAQAALKKQQDIGNLVSTVQNNGDYTYGDLGRLALQAGAKHPFKSMALAGLTAGNIGGLTDGNGVGGQLLGAAGGGLLASQMATNPYMAAMMTLGGGQLGSLFDKLRQQKEQETQLAQQQAQYRR